MEATVQTIATKTSNTILLVGVLVGAFFMVIEPTLRYRE